MLTISQPQLDDVRYVIDEDLLRMGTAVTALRYDTACFGQAPISDILPAGVLDPNWIPVVASRGWIVVTADRRLRTRPTEAPLAIEYGLRAIHLFRAGHLTAWDQARRLLSRWTEIEKHIGDDGPWWLSVRDRQVLRLDYEPGAVERP